MTGNHIGVIFRKELVDNMRDRRSVLSALITPLFMPAFLLTLIILVGKTYLVNPVERSIFLPVEGAQYAPALITFLQQNNVEILPAPSNPQDQVQAGNFDMILVIPSEFEADMRNGSPAGIQMIVDSSRQPAAATVERIRSLLDQYNQEIASLRLMARGINPQVASPMAISSINVATPQSRTLLFLNMLPFLLVVVIFMGGMYVIIDTTAGERERGSLEPLLINPATREEFVLGKLLASLPFALATLIVSLLGFYAVFSLFPLEKYTGFSIHLDFSTVLTLLWISLPIILLAAGLQIIIATFTRSFKEAQTYLALLPLIAGLPGVFLTFLPIQPSIVSMLIPSFSQAVLLSEVMRGTPVNTLDGLLSAGSTIAVSLVLIWVAIRLYQSERVILGR